MDQKSAPVEVPHPNGLASEMKKSDNDSLITNRETHDVSMPICFLVKEQAKSLIAIQDLQRRIENVENIQDDVIDFLVEIRNYLCADTRSISGLTSATSNSVNITNSPIFPNSKLTPLSKARRYSCSPSVLKGTVEPSLILGTKPYILKDCDIISEAKRRSSLNAPENSHKLFDISKPKDSASENDKQDSGLDSDCRDLNDVNPSLIKHSSNWVKQESNDELLQLLDEISQRSEILQKQLAAVEESPALDLKEEMSIRNKNHNAHEHISSIPDEKDKSKLAHLKVKNSLSHQKFQSKLCTSLIDGCDSDEENVPITKHNHTCVPPMHFEGNSIFEKVSKIRRKTANKIDSAMVSSILKETSVVELQRQVLIYLVENAVLHTRLGEFEQMIAFKTSESEKIENGLKDEVRLLMMENRELRIGLDEHKLEVNALKSKLAMLERVLQSVTVENRELTWQLGESLGLQNLSRREFPNFSSSYPLGNVSSSANCIKQSSLLPHSSCQNDTNSNCLKSKLLPNTNNFCGGITVEESNSCCAADVQSTKGAFKYQSGPLHASTPIMPFKQKDQKFSSIKNSNTVSPGNISPANFQSVKKRLKSASIEKDIAFAKSHKSEKCLGESNLSETLVKGLKFPTEDSDTLPSSASKFPFNIIIEKLKSNNDYRLSKRFPATQNDELASSSDEQSHSKPKGMVHQVLGNIGDSNDNKLSQGSSHTKSQESSPVGNIHGKKGRNIHQRIQDILDRIMAESEEA